jgi:hypothetical protein
VNFWINIKNGLPPPSDDGEGFSINVLITNGIEIGLGYYEYEYFGDENDPVRYSSPSWHDATDYVTEGVTHWMPLPALPKDKL